MDDGESRAGKVQLKRSQRKGCVHPDLQQGSVLSGDSRRVRVSREWVSRVLSNALLYSMGAWVARPRKASTKP